MDDVSGLAGTVSELQDLNESLEESHSLAREEYRTEKEKASLMEANRIYYRMQQETAPQLERMQQLVSMLRREDDPEEEGAAFGELVILGAYFKRRNNLLFLSQTRDSIDPAELGYCLKESSASLEILGIPSEFAVDVPRKMLAVDIMHIYDSFQAMLWSCHSELLAMAGKVSEEEDGYSMDISLQLSEDASPHFPKEYSVCKEAEGEYSLSCSYLSEGRVWK